ncbi:MAG: serine hydroxymethyltransferase [Candidatus Dadabacteria bacterium]|nr:MAG: serine hydroxymethyltransferase [Candidatus Dadabacteria bacterium]
MVNQLPLCERDEEVFSLILRETKRQESGLELIPSENFVSEAVLEAMGSVLTNKYAEGQPGKRYYGGCEVVDEVEILAKERAKALFGADFVNVQPHSGATANQAVFEAAVNIGDTVMGMRLDHGGHLTHGLKVNFSGKHYNIVAYGVRESDGLIDEDQVWDLAKKHKPRMIICGASAYSRKINFKFFREVADSVGAVLMADIAHYAGLIASSLYPSPVGYAQLITSTTHKTLRGPRSGLIMGDKDFERAVNRAVFPGLQGGPHIHTIAAKAVCFKEAATEEFKQYSKQVILNAQALAKALAEKGFKIVSGGTDSHLFLVDVRPLGITGKDAANYLEEVRITANMNTIPFDPNPPTVCSGIRLGTPAITTRGMKEEEMRTIADFIYSALENRDNKKKLESIRKDVEDFALSFPLYKHRIVN